MYFSSSLLLAATALFLGTSAFPIPSSTPAVLSPPLNTLHNATRPSTEGSKPAVKVEMGSGVLSQIRQDNPALSSVFVLPPGEDNIARLRIPNLVSLFLSMLSAHRY